jgi:hypothetical protein
MSILDKISTGRKGRAQKVLLYGPEGFGKSTMASRFPNPLFLDIEDSTSQMMGVRRLSREDLKTLKIFETTLDQIAAKKPCQTLIIDTVDWLEQLVIDAVLEAVHLKSIEDFGYGKGYTVLKERFLLTLAKLDSILWAGINVVMVAHSIVRKFEPPEGRAPFDHYELKLSKHVAPLVKEWSDMMLFGNYLLDVETKAKSEAGAKYKAGTVPRERKLYCNATQAWSAKNRHGMQDVEPWDIAVIGAAFARVGAPWGESTAPPQPAPQEPAPAEPTGNNGESPQADARLVEICSKAPDAVNQWLVKNGRIQPGQDYRHVAADFADRIKKGPRRFLSIVTGQPEETFSV